MLAVIRRSIAIDFAKEIDLHVSEALTVYGVSVQFFTAGAGVAVLYHHHLSIVPTLHKWRQQMAILKNHTYAVALAVGVVEEV